MKRVVFCICFFGAFTYSLRISAQKKPDHTYAELHADSVMKKMSMDEKIAQLIIIPAYSNKSPAYEARLLDSVLAYRIGGIIFFQGEIRKQINITNNLQASSRIPLFIGMDAEHGLGWRLKDAIKYPEMLICSACDNEKIIYELGKSIARQCRLMGVHINFAPVADINNNAQNPVIGIRSFGMKREDVSRKAFLYAAGTLSENVMPVAKHFPGHGDTDTDSHKELPYIFHNNRHLDSIELYPFKFLIHTGIPAIMTAHIGVKSLDPEGRPASISRNIINGTLREKLGFEGLCFTDALTMGGLDRYGDEEIAVLALKAGNDILLMPRNIKKTISAIKKAVASAEFSEEIVNKACKKVLKYKFAYGLQKFSPIDFEAVRDSLKDYKYKALKSKIYRNALTLIKNEDNLLPLKKLDTVKLATVWFGQKRKTVFQNMISRYKKTEHFNIPKNINETQLSDIIRKLHRYNTIIVYNSFAKNSPDANFGYEPNLHKLTDALKHKKIILCHPGIPFGLSPYLPIDADAVLITYNNDSLAQAFAAQALFGGIGIGGKLPVSIGNEYPVGSGITTRKTSLGYAGPESIGINPGKFTKIDSVCREAVKSKATPGCCILIAKDGNIIYNKAYGYHTYTQKTKNKTDDIYDVASLTKIMATLPAVMQMFERGEIRLECPVSEYLKELKHHPKGNITPEELLLHNAGLISHIPVFYEAIDEESVPGKLTASKKSATYKLKIGEKVYINPNFKFKPHTFSATPLKGYIKMGNKFYMAPTYIDSLKAEILRSPLDIEKKYKYSDLDFILLKDICEKISGESLDVYCKKNIYDKIGIYHTAYNASHNLSTHSIVPSSYDRLFRKTVLKGEVHDPVAAVMGGIGGHAGLFSSAEDLAKIMQIYLNLGKYGGERFFYPETVKKFTAATTKFKNNRRGLGFDKPDPDPEKITSFCEKSPLSGFGHTGFTGTMAWADPEHNLIYIFLSNRTYPDEFNKKLQRKNIRTHIQEIIYDIILNP